MIDLAETRAMEGAGGTRELTARWHVSSTLTLTSAAHIGGALEGPADMPLVRDRATGHPVLAGSSIAGALRGHLADVLGGYALSPGGSPEHVRAQQLFGAARAADAGDQSALVVHEALAAAGAQPIEIRDGVAIEPSTATAAEHAKYDVELLPAGTMFPLQFELDIVADRHERDPQGSDVVPGAGERELLALLARALGGLEADDAGGAADSDGQAAPIAIGARRSRGLGRCRAGSWHVERFDLTTADGWIALACEDAATSEATGTRIADAVAAALGDAPLGEIDDQRQTTAIDIRLAFDRSLLVRSPAGEDGAPASSDPGIRAPDVVHLRSGGVPVLSGSSLAGALRAHATRIARHIDPDPVRAVARVEALFGSTRRERGGGRGSHDDLSPSALRVAEREVVDATPRRATRIRVDRLTRGVVRGGLFEEEPVVGGTVTVLLELRQPDSTDPPALGLLLLTVRDLVDGLLALGGTVSVGRGAVDRERSSATVRLADGTSLDLRNPDDAGSRRLDELVEALWHADLPSEEQP